MSRQAQDWYRHTLHYLTGIDPHLADLFARAMHRAGFPKEVGEAAAFEAILADFLAGFDTRADRENLDHRVEMARRAHAREGEGR